MEDILAAGGLDMEDGEPPIPCRFFVCCDLKHAWVILGMMDSYGGTQGKYFCPWWYVCVCDQCA